MAEQGLDGSLLGIVIFNHKQSFPTGTRVRLDFVQCIRQPVGRSRLRYKRERSTCQALLAIFIEGEHLHRNVPSRGVLLEVVQYRPTQHVGQEDIERNGNWVVLAGKGERLHSMTRG